MAIKFEAPKFGTKKEDETKKLVSRLSTEVDGIEAYTRVLSMDDRLKDDRNINGIFHQIDLVRDLLEKLGC